jgi:hypothetical protein
VYGGTTAHQGKGDVETIRTIRQNLTNAGREPIAGLSPPGGLRFRNCANSAYVTNLVTNLVDTESVFFGSGKERRVAKYWVELSARGRTFVEAWKRGDQDAAVRASHAAAGIGAVKRMGPAC